MTEQRSLLLKAMRDTSSVKNLPSNKWDMLIRQARGSNMLSTLACALEQSSLLESVPHQPQLHLVAALKLVRRQDIAMRWEVQCIRKALADFDGKIVLLKGAAYMMTGMPFAKGRMFSDVDILVPEESIELVESELMLSGWQSGGLEAYDQRYYRRWMHEIPPMRHVKRGATIDVHHNILPRSAKTKVNINLLLENVVPLVSDANMFTLAPVDMFLHSATHLFHEGNFDKGLRDLFDLDYLLRNLTKQELLSEQLVVRATELGLARYMFYGLRYCSMMIGTPIPSDVLLKSRIGKPSFLVLVLIDQLYSRALEPTHRSRNTFSVKIARFILYVRAHYLRMPLYLLSYHLLRKAFFNTKSDIPAAEETQGQRQ
jgi:hypothetical protein